MRPQLRTASAWRAGLLLVLVLAGAGCARQAASRTPGIDEAFLRDHGIRYWLAVKTEPRPLRLHHLQVDLDNARLEVVAALAHDPDGPGPATAALEPPMTIAERAAAVAMVNANPWQSLPDASGKRSINWREGMPVDILGMAVSGGRVRSPPANRHAGFWLDEQGGAHVGNPPAAAKVREGVAGFTALVEGGQVVPSPVAPLHPRTALGLDASGRRLYLVVVDGRQPGYSEGMSLHELAVYMCELGCASAVNLDGGGSSIMIVAGRDGVRRVINDPCTKRSGVSLPRPIPVALVIRPKGRG